MEAVFGAEHHDGVTSKGARERSALPDGVQRIVGGVEIENDLLGWVAVASINRSTNNAPIFAPSRDPDADLGMAAPDLVENGHRPQARGVLQQGHHLAVPDRSQPIVPSTATRCFLL